MTTADYASAIRGFRFLPGEPGYQYQTTSDFSLESTMRLLTDLPEHCQVSFFDPRAKKEEAWVFVRRLGGTFFVQHVSRGSSRWKSESLGRIIELFTESPMVKEPHAEFDSFRVDLIPEHQRFDHMRGPWWKFW
jgi:hypothetical protein